MSTNGIALGLTYSFAEACAGCFVPWQPAQVPQPRGLMFNRGLAQALGLDADALFTEQGAAMLAGNVLPLDAQPLAQAYAGHQFGNFAPQLGDGRALLLGEAMFHLGVPTTRAVVATGEAVRRERALPGAVLTRFANSSLPCRNHSTNITNPTPPREITPRITAPIAGREAVA